MKEIVSSSFLSLSSRDLLFTRQEMKVKGGGIMR